MPVIGGINPWTLVITSIIAWGVIHFISRYYKKGDGDGEKEEAQDI